MSFSTNFKVNSPNVKYYENFIESTFDYHQTLVSKNSDGSFIAKPIKKTFIFKTNTKVNKLGALIVGLGGNNGTTLFGGITANKL